MGLGVALVADGLAAEAVDGTVPSGGHDPSTGVRRRPLGRPPGHRDGERLLDRVLGEIDVAEDADQGGDASAVLPPEDGGRVGGHSVGSSGAARTVGPRRAADTRRSPASPGERLVEVRGLDDQIPQVLLGLDVRAVGDEDVGARLTDDRRGLDGPQATREHERSGVDHLVVERAHVGERLPQVLRRQVRAGSGMVDGEHVLRHGGLLSVRADPLPAPSTTTKSPPPIRHGFPRRSPSRADHPVGARARGRERRPSPRRERPAGRRRGAPSSAPRSRRGGTPDAARARHPPPSRHGATGARRAIR